MNVTIEHPFCPYCSEVTNLYFRIINTLLFSKDENELRTSMESLKKETRLDEYLNIQFQPVTSFTAITFYIQNFIETQMAIGRTMIFAGLSIYILFWLRHIPL